MAEVVQFSTTLFELDASDAIFNTTGQPGQGGSHSPPPGLQIVGKTRSDQQCSVPRPPAVSSAILKRQVPFTSVPNFPRKTLSGVSGAKVPRNGGAADKMEEP